MAKNKSSISKASSYEAMGEFWDSHDFSEADDISKGDVIFEIVDSISIEAELLVKIEEIAALRGVTPETLVNLWLQEKILAYT